ncbi:MAG: CTP synthetase [Pseudomonadota bacterium]
MNRLALILYIIALPTLTGILVTAVLTIPNYETMWLIYAAIAGPLLAIPVAVLVSREIGKQIR